MTQTADLAPRPDAAVTAPCDDAGQCLMTSLCSNYWLCEGQQAVPHGPGMVRPGVEGPGPFMACEDCHSPHTCAETRDIERCP